MAILMKTEQLQALMAHEAPLSVTILMPVHRNGTDSTRQDHIRFKNLVRQAERASIEAGMKHQDARDRMESLLLLIDDPTFWRNVSDGLAVFSNGRRNFLYHVPLQLKEEVHVGRFFYLKPLMPVIHTGRHYHILAISKNGVTFYQATLYSIQPLILKDVPLNFKDAMKYYEFEKHTEFHSCSSAHTAGARQGTIYHGTTTAETFEREHLLEYCRKINEGVTAIIKNETVPLILAAAEPILSAYRAANTYHHLLDITLTGNPDGIAPPVLHEQSLPLVEPIFLQGECAAMGRYGRMVGSESANNDLKTILLAARDKKIDTLFVAIDEHKWGKFDLAGEKTEIHESRQPGDDDLLNLAAIYAFRGNAKVHAIPGKSIPGRVSAAAILRYAMPAMPQ